MVCCCACVSKAVGLFILELDVDEMVVGAVLAPGHAACPSARAHNVYDYFVVGMGLARSFEIDVVAVSRLRIVSL